MENKSTINWYPGHMSKSIREIEEIAKVSDVIIHVLDARAPFKTFNKTLFDLFRNKEHLFIFSKSDLRDNSKDLEVIKRISGYDYLFCNLKNQKDRKKILSKVNLLSKNKINSMKSKGLISYKVKIFIVGMPNVGKSTLINLLIGKNKLKAENYPGVTKQINWVNVDDKYFLDTPGIMPMKIESDLDGYTLVFLQIIKQSIVNQFLLFQNTFELIHNNYPNYLLKYGFSEKDYSIQFQQKFNNLVENFNKNEKQKIEKILNDLRSMKMTFM